MLIPRYFYVFCYCSVKHCVPATLYYVEHCVKICAVRPVHTLFTLLAHFY